MPISIRIPSTNPVEEGEEESSGGMKSMTDGNYSESAINQIHYGSHSVKRRKSYFAMFASAIMLLTVLSVVSQNTAAESVSEDNSNLLPPLQADDSLGDATPQGLTRERSLRSSPSPGTVTSVTSPLDPAIAGLGEFHMALVFSEFKDRYEYNTSFGKYVFLKNSPYRMNVISYFRENGTIVSKEIVKGSEFVLRSGLNLTLGQEIAVLAASKEMFNVTRTIQLGTCIVGRLTTNVSFKSYTPPKITAFLDIPSLPTSDIGISWKIYPDDSLQVGDKNQNLNLTSKAAESLNINATSLNVSLNQILGDGIASKIGVIDWSDAQSGTAKILAKQSIPNTDLACISVDFPFGSILIDPSIIGTSSVENALPGTPCRNSFYAEGSYWVFWYTGTDIAYKRSSDAIDWSAPQTYLSIPFQLSNVHPFDVAVLDNHVVIAINTTYNDIFFRGGDVSGQVINWRPWVFVYNNGELPRREMNCELAMVGSEIKIIIIVLIQDGELEYIRLYRYDWAGDFREITDSPWLVGACINFVGLTAVRSSMKTISVIVSEEVGYIEDDADGIIWMEYYPEFNAWSDTNSYWISPASAMVPHEFSAVVANDGVIYAVGKMRSAPGNPLLTYIWTLNRVNGTATMSEPLDYPGDERSHGATDDPYGRCTLSKDAFDGLYLFYLNQDYPGSAHYNLLYRYKLSPIADWSPPITVLDYVGIYLYPTSVEISGDATFLTYVKWGSSSSEIYLLSLPTMTRVLGLSPDQWASPGQNADQPMDVHGSGMVSPGNGQLFIKNVDLTARGRDIDLSIGRIYSMPHYFIELSTSLQPYMFNQSKTPNLGDGWELDFPRINGTFVYWWSGQQYLIQYVNNLFTNNRGEFFTLQRYGSPYQYYIHTGNGMNYSFDQYGRLTKIQSDFSWNAANNITFNYVSGRLTQISDTINRKANLTYYADGKLKDITYVGLKISYAYDASGRLTSVTDDAGRQVVYTYKDWFSSFPLLDTIKVPTGAWTKYTYSNLTVGTQAVSNMVVKRSTFNVTTGGEMEEEWTEYSYCAVDGNVRFSRLLIGGINMNSNQSIIDYLMDSSTKSMTVVYRDPSLNELKRTRSWFSPTGRIAKMDNYLAGSSSQIESSNMAYFDTSGNAIYSKDVVGHETYASFANSEFTNAFYRPATLSKLTDGKILSEDFSDQDISDWTAYGTGAIDFDWTIKPDSAPSLRIDHSAGDTTIVHPATAPTSIMLDFELEVGSAGHSYISLRETPTSYASSLVDIFASHDGLLLQISGQQVGTASFTAEKFHRLTFQWVSYKTSGTYNLWIDSVLTCSGTKADARQINYIALCNCAASADFVWFDDIRICTSNTVSIGFFNDGCRIEILDSNGKTVMRQKSTGGNVVFTLPLPTDVFPFGFIVVREPDDTVDMISEGIEIWGGDVYQYTTQTSLYSTLTRWTHTYPYSLSPIKVWDESSDVPQGNQISWVTDPAYAVSGNMYRTGIGEPAPLVVHGWAYSGPNLNIDGNDFLVQYLYLPIDNYPLQVLITVYFDDSYHNHYSSTVSLGALVIDHDPNNMAFNDLGALPSPNQWKELILKASLFGLDYDNSNPYLRTQFTGIDFYVVCGCARWDYTAFCSGGWPYIEMNNLEGATQVKLYDENNVCLGTSSVIYETADLWSSSQSIPWSGIFPIRGYFVITFNDGTIMRTDERDIFAGDVFVYQYQSTLFSPYSPTLLEPYRNLPVGTFEKTGTGYLIYDSYAFMRYGKWSGSTWEYPSRLNQTMVNQGSSWPTVNYTYSGTYNLLSYSLDPFGLVSRYFYASGAYVNLTQTYNKAGSQKIITRYNWDAGKDLLLGEMNPRGYWTNYSYDEIGRNTMVTYPAVNGTASSVQCFYLDNITTSLRDGNNHWFRTTVDGWGRAYLEERLNEMGGYYSGVYREFDWNGKVTYEENYGTHFSSKIQNYYDSFGRLWQSRNPDDGTYGTISYDDVNRKITTRDEVGRWETASYDIAGRLIATMQLNGTQLINSSYYYDPVGNLVAISAGSSAPYLKHKHYYDNSNRLIRTDFIVNGANSESEIYSYDSVGHLTLKKLRNGNYEYLKYDTLGRLKNISYGTSANGPPTPDWGRTDYAYDPNGNIIYANRTSVLNPSPSAIIALRYVYDSRDRMYNETYKYDGKMFTMTYNYDNNSNIKRIIYPKGQTIDYVRDYYDRIIQIKQGSYIFAQLYYDPLDRYTSVVYGNAVHTNYYYFVDGSNRLSRSYTYLGSTTILDMQYSYDDSGKITTISDGTYPESFKYDQVGRLWNASCSAGDPTGYGWRNYSYDSLGNILKIVKKPQSGSKDTWTYSYDTSNGKYRLTSITSSLSGNIRTLTYDSSGQAVTRTVPGQVSKTLLYEMDGLMYRVGAKSDMTARYDAFSRRVTFYDSGDLGSDKSKDHIFMGDRVAYDWEETSAKYLTCYVYADGLLLGKIYGSSSNPTQYKEFIHLDHLGSVRRMTNASGVVRFSARYEPYGAPIIALQTDKSAFKYIGQVRDELTGLSCFGVRFYDAEIGRFLCEDPVLGSPAEPLSMNRYSYCIDDPINLADPSGEFFWLVFAGIILGSAIVGGTITAAEYSASHQTDWNWGGFLTSAFTGAAVGAGTGAIAGSLMCACPAEAGLLMTVVWFGSAAGIGYEADRMIEWAQTGTLEFNIKDLAFSIGVGAALGAAFKGLPKIFKPSERPDSVMPMKGPGDPRWPGTPQEMDQFLGIKGKLVEGASGGKMSWQFKNAAGEAREITGHSVEYAINPAKRAWHWHYKPGHYVGYPNNEMPDWLIKVLRGGGII